MRLNETRGRKPTHKATINYEKSRAYVAWVAMKVHCYNQDSVAYRYYGAKGITVCDRWKDSFKNFLEDMGDAPESTASLRRRNKKGNYDKHNCFWALIPKVYYFDNQAKTLREWAEEYHIKFATLANRIYTQKWPIEKALTTPIRQFTKEKHHETK